jgi:hypothetical protein
MVSSGKTLWTAKVRNAIVHNVKAFDRRLKAVFGISFLKIN